MPLHEHVLRPLDARRQGEGHGSQIVSQETLRAAGIACEVTRRIGEGHPNVRDVLAAGDVSFIINTPHGHGSHGDGSVLRSEAVNRGITYVTTLSAAAALVLALAAVRGTDGLPVYALQDLAARGGAGTCR